METLNMAKLNLSSVRSTAPTESIAKQEEKYESSLLDTEDEYPCEYREDIWNTLLEQDAEKPVIHLQSPQLEFRGSLVQQLREVSKKLGLTIATLHSAVAQLDLFMDAHRLRADRLTHVALACLSLAAKSEEKLNKAPTLKTLSKVSGVQLCGKTFRQLEWMVAQHVRWRLLTPTPVSFATILARYVVTDSDLTTRHPKFVRRFKRDGAKLLEAYLDLTLSDVRLKVVESVDVGCASVACARAELGLSAWPAWLAAASARTPATVAPIARLLQRMMQILKSRDNESDIDQGYNSVRNSPTFASPCPVSTHRLRENDSTYRQHENDSSHRPRDSHLSYRQHETDSLHRPRDSNLSYRQHENDSSHRARENNLSYRPRENNLSYCPRENDLSYRRENDLSYRPTFEYPINVDESLLTQYIPNQNDYSFCRSRRLIDAMSSVPSTSMAVKRSLDSNVDIDNKRYRLANQMSQVVL